MCMSASYSFGACEKILGTSLGKRRTRCASNMSASPAGKREEEGRKGKEKKRKREEGKFNPKRVTYDYVATSERVKLRPGFSRQ